MKKSTLESAFAVTPPGLEEICAAELQALGLTVETPIRGGVSFSADRVQIYRTNLWLRTAVRVLVRLGSVRCKDFPALFKQAVRLPWGRYIKPDTPLQVHVSCSHSRLNHTGRIAETVQQAIVRALGDVPAAADRTVQEVWVRLEQDVATFSIDSSGDRLHRRGYRQEQGKAPLRENLAAGLLALAGWTPDEPLWDPLCGSGTLIVEAAMIAANRPPGGQRSFAFTQWPKYYPQQFQALLDDLDEMPAAAPLFGTDRDPQMVTIAQRNATRAGVAERCSFSAAAVGQTVDLPAETGLILSNPPYGERLSDPGELIALYRRFADLLSTRAQGWRCVLLAPEVRWIQQAGLKTQVLSHLSNGGLKVALVECSL